ISHTICKRNSGIAVSLNQVGGHGVLTAATLARQSDVQHGICPQYTNLSDATPKSYTESCQANEGWLASALIRTPYSEVSMHSSSAWVASSASSSGTNVMISSCTGMMRRSPHLVCRRRR